MTNPATHARLDTIAHDAGTLHIASTPLPRLVEMVGRTPCYIYDRDAITQRVAALRAALPAQVKLHYAIKANPMPALVAHLGQLVDGFDVASQHEMLVALSAGMSAASISFAGPAKRDAEVRAAVAAGVCLNVESELEIERIARHGAELGVAPRIALGVNPEFQLKGAGMKMGGGASPFGIDAERVPAALAQLSSLGLRCAGLHLYCGSQNLNAAAIVEANRLSLEFALKIAQDCATRFEFINIGGGYGIPYFAGERALDLEAVGAGLAQLFQRHAAALEDLQVIVELGRYLVGEAGYYVTRVVDIKKSQDKLFVMVDGGLHHHLANSGNFGQVLRKNYPVVIGNKLADEPALVVTIAGPLCTPLDIVADKLPVPSLAVGDLVVVLQSGAYGYSASPLLFLGHPAPPEILV